MALPKSTRFRRFFCILILLLTFLKYGTAQVPTEKVVQAADRFLSTLTEAERQKVQYSFDDAQQRARWSNFPTGFVPRGGISLKQMSTAQQAAALELMKTVLSPMGYQKVRGIRMADDDFKANGSKKGPRGGGPPPGNQGPPPGGSLPAGARRGQVGPPPFATGDMFGSDLYYISFLRMSTEELEAYAQSGTLPDWFPASAAQS
jgi:hypothetical protein